jgi:hypothetical protein
MEQETHLNLPGHDDDDEEEEIFSFFLEIFELLTRLGGSHLDLNRFQTIIRSYTAFSDTENVPSAEIRYSIFSTRSKMCF